MAIKEALFAELRNAVENNGGILPSEVELSAKLGISRTQIRDYLAIYENERLIVRQRRKGAQVLRITKKLRRTKCLRTKLLTP